MQVIRHIAVRDDRELFIDRGAPNLRTDNFDALALSKGQVPLIRAVGEEISVLAQIIKAP